VCGRRSDPSSLALGLQVSQIVDVRGAASQTMRIGASVKYLVQSCSNMHQRKCTKDFTKPFASPMVFWPMRAAKEYFLDYSMMRSLAGKDPPDTARSEGQARITQFIGCVEGIIPDKYISAAETGYSMSALRQLIKTNCSNYTGPDGKGRNGEDFSKGEATMNIVPLGACTKTSCPPEEEYCPKMKKSAGTGDERKVKVAGAKFAKKNWRGCLSRVRIAFNICTTCCCKEGLIDSSVQHELIFGSKEDCSLWHATTDSVVRLVTNLWRTGATVDNFGRICFESCSKAWKLAD